MGPNVSEVRRSIGQEQEGLRDGADLIVVGASHGVAEPALGGLSRQVNAVTLRPERFGHEATHRRLPRAVDSFERHEAGEHA